MLIRNDLINKKGFGGFLFWFKMMALFTFTVLISLPGVVFADTDAPCEPVETKPVKIEGWISKKFKKDLSSISKEFAAMGNTNVDLRAFPMGDAAAVTAIGRCVPAHIARHALENALKYTGGVSALINDSFVAPHWIGIGATIFDEPSQQKVTEDQVKQLLNSALTTEEFHALYHKFSKQDDSSMRWGQTVPNIKRPDRIYDK
ncbi:MAG: hypothetical protein A3K09_00895 [Nitrospinae bacterium RIFCSPLOWO2_12_FULL_47_7]|nr:MAG: hypothetical protein A3K09_00895 [Nitrospinae bacterium RIFCSPLOWO2_12_FULL_47_7]